MEKDGLAGNIVYALAQDSDGVYWFGTNKGLSRYDGENWDNWNIHNGLPGNDVYAIATTPDGEVWIGTRSGVTRLVMRNSHALNSTDVLCRKQYLNYLPVRLPELGCEH